MTCPKCDGSGTRKVPGIRQVGQGPPGAPNASTGAAEVRCDLCRGSGQAPGWDKPLAGKIT